MRSDHSSALSIFHIDKCMTWCQVKKMSSSSLSISIWLKSHYFFKHCNHDFQTEINYFIWYLFINYLMILSIWWRCFSISTWSFKLQILQSLVITTLILRLTFSLDIFSFLWHWHVINLLRRSIVTVRKNVVTWVKTLHDNFSDHATF